MEKKDNVAKMITFPREKWDKLTKVAAIRTLNNPDRKLTPNALVTETSLTFLENQEELPTPNNP